MASPPPPGHEEDQTDADFFDNLAVNDGSGSVPGDMAEAFSNMSISDMSTPADDLAADTLEAEDGQEGVNVPLPEPPQEDGLVMEGSVSPVSPGNEVVPHSDPVGTGEMGSPVSTTMERAGSRFTSVKEVQWSSFSSEQAQFDVGGSGSIMDFPTDVPDGSADGQMVSTDSRGIPGEKPFAHPSTYFGSSEQLYEQAHGMPNEHISYLSSTEQQNTQAYEATNAQVAGGNDSQYWENLYPGQQYDGSSDQFYQGDSYGTTADAQVNGYDPITTGSQEGFQEKAQWAGDEIVEEQISGISYLQQTTESVVESIVEGCMTGGTTDWNQVPQGSSYYPPNMVFYPQYPNWYFDANTKKWCTLESYTQSYQASSTCQSQLAQDVGASLDFLPPEQNHTWYNNEIRQEVGGDLDGPLSNYSQNMWQPEPDDKSRSIAVFSGNHQTGNFYGPRNHERGYADRQNGFMTTETIHSHNNGGIGGTVAFPGFVHTESIYQFNQPKVEQTQQANVSQNYYLTQDSINYSEKPFPSGSVTYSQFSYNPRGGGSSAGRMSHALVTFGFGGKLIIMKDTTFSSSLAYGSQDSRAGTISVLNLAEVVMEKTDTSNFGTHGCDYFHVLCKQSFPGPLVGGNASSKDLNKWINERIAGCEASMMDFRKGEFLRLLLSLLKISCQHYGKLRSPIGADPLLQGTDGPESDITRLFASARKNGAHLGEYGAFTHCMHNLPAEGQIQTTADDVQKLLVSGRRKEALQCAQEGQLWGPALILAAQLGEKFYVDTVKQMAHHQFVSGSPLRTLCMLIAGQPADVFSAESSNSNLAASINILQQPAQAPGSGMLDDWEQNLAIIMANRTKDDELVMVHLGDCLWKERGEVVAAHTCYLVAEANFESYSDSARLCLIGADHWKYPRTYANPEAIQRTEVYEHSKVLGNSQFILLPFQPYKLLYAYMLTEVGKNSDALKYCQAIVKSLKNSGRTPEVETWKQLASSLEERLRTHLQGGYGTNLAPAKLVGKIFTSIDRSIHRMIGAPPPPLPPIPQSNEYTNEPDNFSMAPALAYSQSTMAMSSLIPSASVQTISEWTGDNKKTKHNRSISEPDFGRSPKQVNSSNDAQNRALSGFGRFGSQLFQKTMGWMSRSRPYREAKLGEKNKLYYDKDLKRWVEEGAEPPAEEVALPPPPTSSSFQNGIPDYNINSALTSQSLPANGGLVTKKSNSTEHSPGIPPLPPSQNQFSARARMGVRSRYVDTFNKGGGMTTGSFQSPSPLSAKPVRSPNKFFVPTPAAFGEPTYATESTQVVFRTEDSSPSVVRESSSSFTPSPSSLSTHCFPSMDNISPIRNKSMEAALQNGNDSLSSRSRAASWSGIYSDTSNHNMNNLKPLVDGFGVPSSFMPNHHSHMRPASSSSQANGNSLGDDLHEVEL